MDRYKRHFRKEIDYYSGKLLQIVLCSIFIDLFFTYSEFPVPVNMLSTTTGIINVILIILYKLKKITGCWACILLSYVFTFNIYFPGFIDHFNMQQSIISGFTNIGPCCLLLLFIAFLGEKIHSISLGIINITCILGIYFLSPYELTLEPANIICVGSSAFFAILIVKKIDRRLKKLEEEQNQALCYEHQIDAAPSDMISDTSEKSEKICFVSGREKFYFPWNKITHISIQEHYASIFIIENHKITKKQIKLSLAKILQTLKGKNFIRIHRSHAVNIDHTSSLIKNNNSFVVRIKNSDIYVPVSRRNLPLLKKLLQ